MGNIIGVKQHYQMQLNNIELKFSQMQINNIELKVSQKIETRTNNIQLTLPRKIYNKLTKYYLLNINLSYIISNHECNINKQYIYKCIFDFDTFLYQINNLINILIKKYSDISIITNTLNIINQIFKKNIIQYQYILQNNIDDYYLNLLNNFINDIDYIITNFNNLIYNYPIIENELNNLKIYYDEFEYIIENINSPKSIKENSSKSIIENELNNLEIHYDEFENINSPKSIKENLEENTYSLKIINEESFINKLINFKIIFIILFKK